MTTLRRTLRRSCPRSLATTTERSGQHALLIALDGENAWEYYPFNGYYFLRALYAALADHPSIELVTLSDCVERGLQALPLQKVVTGSWVHGTLATWMGDPAKNAAWDLLCEAKLAFDRVMREGPFARVGRRRATLMPSSISLRSARAPTGSGGSAITIRPKPLPSSIRLYRRQLVNLYRLLGLPPPANLDHPISIGRGSPEAGGVMRRASASG